MKTAVRYYSRSGNTKSIAKALARAAKVEAVSVDAEGALINEDTDLLFIGGALYAYGLDDHLKKYLSDLDGSRIKKAAVFSSTWISKHSIDLIKKGLRDKGVEVAEEYFYVRGKPDEETLKKAEAFALRLLK